MTILDEIAHEKHQHFNLAEHNARHDVPISDGKLALVAACYAVGSTYLCAAGPGWVWPWKESEFRQFGKNSRSRLIHAAAALLAEIERIDAGAVP